MKGTGADRQQPLSAFSFVVSSLWKKVIILIDEYDAPLQRAYENGYYDDMVRLIRQIFGYALKSNGALYFSALTGCMRVSRESIFSNLNNPVIHSISDEQFDEWFGFTDVETIRILEDLGLSAHYEVTKEWYDGYLTQQTRYHDGSYDLRIPNREVRNIFMIKVDEWFKTKVLDDKEGLKEFFSAFTGGDARALEDCLNVRLGESISYLDGGKYEDKETFYHGLQENNLSADAQAALDQIDIQQYDQYFRSREPKHIQHYGIAFCGKLCRVLTD